MKFFLKALRLLPEEDIDFNNDSSTLYLRDTKEARCLMYEEQANGMYITRKDNCRWLEFANEFPEKIYLPENTAPQKCKMWLFKSYDYDTQMFTYFNGLSDIGPKKHLYKEQKLSLRDMEQLAGLHPEINNQMSQADRAELFGTLIDVVEDWLEEKGITPEMIPNIEREDENSAIIYGTDYDYLADKFAEVLGIDRDNFEELNNYLEK